MDKLYYEQRDTNMYLFENEIDTIYQLLKSKKMISIEALFFLKNIVESAIEYGKGNYKDCKFLKPDDAFTILLNIAKLHLYSLEDYEKLILSALEQLENKDFSNIKLVENFVKAISNYIINTKNNSLFYKEDNYYGYSYFV